MGEVGVPRRPNALGNRGQHSDFTHSGPCGPRSKHEHKMMTAEPDSAGMPAPQTPRRGPQQGSQPQIIASPQAVHGARADSLQHEDDQHLHNTLTSEVFSQGGSAMDGSNN